MKLGKNIGLKKKEKKALLKWIVFCEVMYSKIITSFSLYY